MWHEWWHIEIGGFAASVCLLWKGSLLIIRLLMHNTWTSECLRLQDKLLMLQYGNNHRFRLLYAKVQSICYIWRVQSCQSCNLNLGFGEGNALQVSAKSLLNMHGECETQQQAGRTKQVISRAARSCNGTKIRHQMLGCSSYVKLLMKPNSNKPCRKKPVQSVDSVYSLLHNLQWIEVTKIATF